MALYFFSTNICSFDLWYKSSSLIFQLYNGTSVTWMQFLEQRPHRFILPQSFWEINWPVSIEASSFLFENLCFYFVHAVIAVAVESTCLNLGFRDHIYSIQDGSLSTSHICNFHLPYITLGIVFQNQEWWIRVGIKSDSVCSKQKICSRETFAK